MTALGEDFLKMTGVSSRVNKYMRAIGFSKPPKRDEISRLIERGISNPSHRAYTTDDHDENALLAQFDIELGADSSMRVISFIQNISIRM